MSQRGERLGFATLTGSVLMGALLLFGMEPLVGRMVVPYFGGAVHVWLTCLMFFQAILLAGYTYAHLLARRVGVWHLAVLFLPLVVLPLGVESEVAPDAPMGSLLAVLLRYVALPFAVLSTTAVVMQTWLAHSELAETREPYPLYAASNLGSLVALLGYPFLVEPLFGLRAQSLVWTAGYVVYVALVIWSWLALRPDLRERARAPEAFERTHQSETPPTAREMGLWLTLSALPSAFLLATTNVIATEVGSFPMVWVIPLGLYLGTFVYTFRERGGAPRIIGALWPEILLSALLLYGSGISHWATAVAICGILPLLSLVCHGDLYTSRPHPRWLTRFYLLIAVGGWLGGAAVALLGPILFSGLWEYPITLVLFAGVLGYTRGGRFVDFWRDVPLVRGGPRALVLGFLLLACFASARALLGVDRLLLHRNFYGVYTVRDRAPSEGAPGGVRMLVHGNTTHGEQALPPGDTRVSTTYYHESQCMGDVYDSLAKPMRAAVIGLGAGVLATRTGPGDVLDYYEIDPDNEAIARAWFMFLDEAGGDVRVHVGDGRLNLSTSSRRYALILMDAFSGDGIPTHLLTREAFAIYLDRLDEGGVLLLHVSNRYYELRPTIKANAAELGLAGVYNASPRDVPNLAQPALCVALALAEEPLAALVDRGWDRLDEADRFPTVHPWSDDYINVLSALWAKATVQTWVD